MPAGRPSCPGVGKTLEQKIVALLDTGEIPSAAKLKREVPALPGRGDQGPRSRARRRRAASTTSSASRASRSCAPPPKQQRIRELKGLGPKAEENVLAALGRLADEAPDRAAAALRGAADRRAAGGGPARPPRQRRGRGRRLGAAPNRDLPRHRPRSPPPASPRRLGRRFCEHPLAATKGSSGRGRRSDHDPQRDRASTCGSSRPAAYGNLLQHFTGSAEHNIELRERARGDGALGLRARDHRHEHRGGLQLRDRGGGLRAPRPRLHRARAARGQRRDRRRGRRHAARAGRLGGHPRRPPLPHHALRRPQHARGDGGGRARARGYAYLAVTDHSASHGFGNHVTPERLRERIEEVREFNSGPPRLPAARRLGGQHPPGRLARLRGRPARRARLGDRQRPHLVQDLRSER